MKYPSASEPPVFRRADLWLAKRSPVLWAARAHYAAFGLALLWGALGLWRAFGGLSPMQAVALPRWLLDSWSGFYVGLWTAFAVLGAFWAVGAYRRSGLRLFRRRPVRAAFAELLVFWLVLAGLGLWPLALQKTVLDTVERSISDQELADDLRRLNNGAPFFGPNATIIPAEEAFYRDRLPLTNTLYWNILHAPLDTVNDVIHWQNPEISPYRVNFTRLFDGRPLKVRDLTGYGLPEDKAPFTLADSLRKLAQDKTWVEGKCPLVDFEDIFTYRADPSSPIYEKVFPSLREPIKQFKSGGSPGYLMYELVENYSIEVIRSLKSERGKKGYGFEQFCKVMREMNIKPAILTLEKRAIKAWIIYLSG